MTISKRLLLLLTAGLLIGLLLGGGVFFFSAAIPGVFLGRNRSELNLQTGSPRIGQAAPEFTALNLTGESFGEEIFTGNNTVLNFWATWCVPCRAEMPVLQAAYQQNPSRLQIIGINAGETKQQILPFLEEFGIQFDIALDPDGNVQRNYAVLGLPITFFIDENGVILAQHIGELSELQLAGYLELLGVDGD